MARYQESLTIRITGESSQLRRELDAVADRMRAVQTQMSRFLQTDPAISSYGSRMSQALQPLESASRWFDRMAGASRSLSDMPVRMNVGPAMNALEALNRGLESTSSRMLMLGTPAAGALPFPMFRRFAQGGLVTGPAGIDQVPALLTSGEYVLRPPAVQQLGVAFLEALNQRGTPRDGGTGRSAAPMAASPAGTVNHFGGITVHVQQAAEVNDLVRDLRLQGFRLRNRRG